MPEIIAAVEEMFRLKGEGKVEMPPKPGVHTRKDSFIHAMPAYIKGDNEAVGLKWVGGYPANSAKGLPYITGLFILNDPETGIPLCVMDCAWLTAMRTGAATAVAAKHLARPESKTLGIIGCGVQGRSNLLALKEVFSLEKVVAHDKFETAARAFKEEMESATGLEIEIAPTPKEAVSGMDLIVTAGVWTNEPLAVIQPDWMDPGSFASPVDMDSYWAPSAIKAADVFCLDDLGQFENFSAQGCFKDFPSPDCDLGSVVAGVSSGRSDASQRIVGLNIGMALDDVAVAPLIYGKALKAGIGVMLPL
jgi:ornithine cyclodeaminase/alanine dehydrogenase